MGVSVFLLRCEMFRDAEPAQELGVQQISRQQHYFRALPSSRSDRAGRYGKSDANERRGRRARKGLTAQLRSSTNG